MPLANCERNMLEHGFAYHTWLVNVGPMSAERLQKAHHAVHLSGDAGRYLCNMIYYKSLRQSQEHFAAGKDRRWHSLFVHVPPFVRIGEDEQLSFLSDLLDQLVDMTAADRRTVTQPPVFAYAAGSPTAEQVVAGLA